MIGSAVRLMKGLKETCLGCGGASCLEKCGVGMYDICNGLYIGGWMGGWMITCGAGGGCTCGWIMDCI